jgi:hypothetical protein
MQKYTEDQVAAWFLAKDIDGNGEVEKNEFVTSSDHFELVCVNRSHSNPLSSVSNLLKKLKKRYSNGIGMMIIVGA